jgi:hypothetical protein
VYHLNHQTVVFLFFVFNFFSSSTDTQCAGGPQFTSNRCFDFGNEQKRNEREKERERKGKRKKERKKEREEGKEKERERKKREREKGSAFTVLSLFSHSLQFQPSSLPPTTRHDRIIPNETLSVHIFDEILIEKQSAIDIIDLP